MKNSVWTQLLILALGLVLGYSFAVQGGSSLISKAMLKAPQLNVNQPTVTLGLIAVVVVAIFILARRR